MNRELLEKMTKEELLELVIRQNDMINSLDQLRYDSDAVMEHLVRVTSGMHNLRYHDAERIHDQDRLDGWIRDVYMKYPSALLPTEYPQDVTPAEADKEERNNGGNE